jgi:crossover junction endodeoxyribonuclease RuvC
MTVVVGLDVSLAKAGLAVVGSHGSATEKMENPPPKLPKGVKPTLAQRADRIDRFQDEILGWVYDAAPDLTVIEQPAYSKNTQTHDMSGVWWGVVGALHRMGYAVAEVSPSVRPIYAVGKGSGKGTDKDAVLAAVVKRYPAFDVTGNDVADALILAMMGSRHLGEPLDDPMPQTHLRAIDSVRWP